MEDVLEVYKRPPDPARPVVCMDEQPHQLVRESRQPVPAAPGRPERYDYEYERAGTACIFLFSQPLGAWRRTSVRRRRTRTDWAQEVRLLLEEDFPEAEKVVLVCDQLNTHNIGSLYQAFEPTVARGLAERLEIHHTPKHGSWLNIAEIELAALTLQCLGRRIGSLEVLAGETTAWHEERNISQTGVNWQFTTEKARIKLRHIYPQFQS